MYQELWIPPIVELPQFNLVGGYLNQFAKERISLKKKEAKTLNKAIHKIATSSDTIDDHTRKYDFIIEKLITKYSACGSMISKLETRNTPIIPTNTNQVIRVEELQKERIKLKKEEVPYLQYIAQLPSKKVDTDSPLCCLQENSFVVSEIFLPGSLYRPPKHVIKKLIPVKELGQFNEIIHEKLIDSSIQGIIPENPLAVKPLDTICRFLLNANLFTQDNNKIKLPINIQTWEVNLKEESSKIADNFFRELEDKLFDIQFHKLEFFKLACDKLPRNRIRIVKVKKYWTLSSSKLKQMKWAPFSKWNNPLIIKEIEEEKIGLIGFSIPNTPITFNYIPNTDLELYDAKKAFFSTIQINTTNTINNKGPDLITASVDPKEKEISRDNSTDDDTSSNADPTENTKINTSLMPQKRSFLDSDLQSLIKRKRTSFEQSKIQHMGSAALTTDSMEEDVSEIFQSGIFEKTTESSFQNSSKKRTGAMKMPQEEESGLFDFHFNLNSQLDIKDRLIIFNVNKINKNYKLLQYLINQSGQCCTIIERELITECDLILNSCTCVIRMELGKFFQKDGSNRLHYSDVISSCLAEYKRVKVIIEYKSDTYLYDKDVFWKVFYFLPFPKFELFFVARDDIPVLAHCMTQLIWKEATDEFTEEDFMEEDMKSGGILLSTLNFNPILVNTLLGSYTLSDLISRVNNGLDPQLVQLMTIPQLNRLKRLNSINW